MTQWRRKTDVTVDSDVCGVQIRLAIDEVNSLAVSLLLCNACGLSFLGLAVGFLLGSPVCFFFKLPLRGSSLSFTLGLSLAL